MNSFQSMQGGESMTIDQKVYSPGDFVYYDVPENKRKFNLKLPAILLNSKNFGDFFYS